MLTPMMRHRMTLRSPVSIAPWLLLLLWTALLGFPAGLPAQSPPPSPASPQTPPKTLRVVTSFMPVYCLTAQVAGDLAEVSNLLPGNVGPHDYQPTRSDIVRLNKADLLIVNGLKLEDWLDRMLKGVRSGKPLKVVEISAGLDAGLIREVPTLDLPQAREGKGQEAADHGHAHDHDHDHGHDHGDANPHIWLDPLYAAHAVTNILKAFQEADPARAEGYAANARRVVTQLHALHADFQKALEPLKSVPFITYHDAFSYMARRYDLKITGIVEQTPEVSPGPKYLDALRKVIRERKVKVIFAEPQFPKRLAEQLARDTGIQLGTLDTLETASDGKLTPASYENGMRQNLEVLQKYLR